MTSENYYMLESLLGSLTKEDEERLFEYLKLKKIERLSQTNEQNLSQTQTNLAQIEVLLNAIKIPASQVTIYIRNGNYASTQSKTPLFEFPNSFIIPCTFYKVYTKISPRNQFVTLLLDLSYPNHFYGTEQARFITYTVTGIYSKPLNYRELDGLELEQLDWSIHICNLERSHKWEVPIEITWKPFHSKYRELSFPML